MGKKASKLYLLDDPALIHLAKGHLIYFQIFNIGCVYQPISAMGDGYISIRDSWHSNTHQHQPSLAKTGVADKNLVQWHLSFLNPDSHSPITSWPALPQLAPISWSVFPIPLPHFHLIWPQYFHLIWPGHVSNMFWVMAWAPPSHTPKREKISFHILRQRSPYGSSQTSFPKDMQIKMVGWWVLKLWVMTSYNIGIHSLPSS